MRGNLSDKLFPSIIRDLAKQNATGRLRLTRIGKIREILIESGIPVFASSTIPEEQPEYKLVQEGLITPEQLDAVMLTARQAAQPVERVLVQTKTVTRLVLQRILCELSTAIVNSSSEWVAGDYRFEAAPKVPLEAKLIWTPTECILTGARYASANNAVLDALAPDDRTVKPVCDKGNTDASSASLSSTEGYVLSCIQSPTTIAEASMLTGLSHIETRRAILVLIMLDLLEAERSATNGAGARKQLRTDKKPAQPLPAARQEVRTPAQTTPPTRSAASSEPAAVSPAQSEPAIASDSNARSARTESGAGKVASSTPSPATKPEAWPLDLESNNYVGLDDDSSQIDFNSGEIPFIDLPEQAGPPQTTQPGAVPAQSSAGHPSGSIHIPGRADSPPPERDRAGATNPQAGAARTGSISLPANATSPGQGQVNSPTVTSGTVAPIRGNTGSTFTPGPTPQPAPVPAISAPATASSSQPLRQKTGSIFIPGRTPQPAPGSANSASSTSSPSQPLREKTGSVFIPGRTTANSSSATPPATSRIDSTGSPSTPGAIASRDSATSQPVTPPRVAPFRANAGSVHTPADGARLQQDSPAPAPFAAAYSAPIRNYQESPNESGAPPERHIAPPPAPQAGSADSDSGYYGYNGESDPRLHQQWRDQATTPASQDNGDDERFLKRVIEELGAKIRIAASADYYQILGIDKLASNGSITKAYERITRINESHKSRWPYNADLQAQISSLMVVVNKAYDTLGNPEKRRLYDLPPKQQAQAMEIERGSGPGSSGARSAAPPMQRPSPTPAPSPPSGGLAGQAAESRNPYQAGEEMYLRGRAAFARSDLQAAAHLLRQAVNLDPNRSTYHYQLGMTLFILSQARAEHKHDKGCHVTCKMGGNLTRNQRIRHEAEQHLLKASELEPSNSDIKLKLALLYKDAHMDRKAHQYFYEALMLDPNCHIARVELGMDDTGKKEKDEDQWIKDLMKDRSKKK